MRGSRRRIGSVVVALLAVSALAVVGAILVAGRDDRYTAANQRLIAELAVYPGAEEVTREDHRHDPHESLWPAGWTTDVTYTVPEGTSAHDLLAFYESAAAEEWRHERPEHLGPNRELLVMCSGQQRVVVLADRVQQTREYTLSVDHDYTAGPDSDCFT